MTSTQVKTALPDPRLGPLRGLRVIEISAYVASPLAGQVLGQLGADVIRVEPLGGQVDRSRMPLSPEGTSLYWAGLNQGKRSVAVDFRSAAGREIVAELASAPGAGGGLVISNTTAFPDLQRRGLAERRPDVIVVQLAGFRGGAPAIDFTVQAAVGLHGLTGPRAHAGPVNDTMPFWDLACGLYLATGLLAAVRRRDLTGDGGLVEVALHDVALSGVGNLGLLADAQLGVSPRERDGNFVFGTLGSDFETKDGRRVMAVFLTARHWHQMVELANLKPLVAAAAETWGVDLDDDHARYEHRDVLTSLLRPWFRERTLDDVVAELGRTNILFSEYLTFGDLVADGGRRLKESRLISEVDGPGIGPHLAAGSPVVVDGQQVPARPAPTVGQHGDEVLAEVLGWDPARAAQLRSDGVLG